MTQQPSICLVEAANLLARTDLMLQIRTIIKERRLTQVQAAKILKVRQPRVAEIVAMKIQDYSVDTLLKYLARLGKKVNMTFSDIDQVDELFEIYDNGIGQLRILYTYDQFH